jgi:hypothetical protein
MIMVDRQISFRLFFMANGADATLALQQFQVLPAGYAVCMISALTVTITVPAHFDH